jgi:hypothetical protein
MLPTTVPEMTGPGLVDVTEHITEPGVEPGFVSMIVPTICPLSVMMRFSDVSWKSPVPPDENVR